jgi:hypothetical protein
VSLDEHSRGALDLPGFAIDSHHTALQRSPAAARAASTCHVSNEIAKQVRGQSSDHPRQSSYRTEVISVNEHALPAKALNGAPKLRDRATIEPVGRNENVARGHDSEKCKKLCGMP